MALRKATLSNDIPYRIGRSRTGLGLFAVRPIKKGECLVEYVGNKIPTKEADDHGGKYLFEINRRWTIDGAPRWNHARYANHSCSPNCETDIVQGRVFVFALKNIQAGEELTYDYGEEYIDEFIKPLGCKCIPCEKKKSR